ncbi:permease, partial [Amylibacter sp.]|nr:permease [Amylibacter sp.]
DSILRGSASASITVSRSGCAPAMADIKTLKEFMADHPGPTNK